MMTTDQKYIKRCLQLARNGLGTTYPNPLVGSVIVSDEGKIIGEGWHYKSGQPHAEVMAVRDAEKKSFTQQAFAKATLYVNLEPCSHVGRTPACASMIVEKGFRKVVVGTLDPHKKVAGKGVAILKAGGVDVTVGVLEAACNELNKRFFTFHKEKRPYIILKWAESADGFIAPLTKQRQAPVWISNIFSRQDAHRLRAQEHAILVGGKTVLEDNPSLTCRNWAGEQPVRIVVDSKNNLSSDFKIFDQQAQSIRVNSSLTDIEKILAQLFDQDIQSVIVEGGSKTIQAFVDQQKWDEAYQYTGTEVLLSKGTLAPKLQGDYALKSQKRLGSDLLKVFKTL